MKNNETIYTLKKACLIFSDYTMATDPTDKDALLEILSDYIYALDDPKAILIYSKICDSDESEREMYIEILGDILENMSPDN